MRGVLEIGPFVFYEMVSPTRKNDLSLLCKSPAAMGTDWEPRKTVIRVTRFSNSQTLFLQFQSSSSSSSKATGKRGPGGTTTRSARDPKNNREIIRRFL